MARAFAAILLALAVRGIVGPRHTTGWLFSLGILLHQR